LKNPIECPATVEGQQDLVPLYLAGKLTEEDAEAFEAHYFACATCREEVRAGALLREFYGKPAVAAAGRPAPTRRSWLPLAAAAAIAFVGLGVWQLSRRTAEEPGQPVLRGPSAEVLVVRIETAPRGGVELSWQTHPRAAVYQIQVFAADGTRVWRAEAKEPRLSIGSGVLPSPGPGKSFEVEVQALDSMQQVVATSDPIPLKTPR
jgi:putative zinc finger protein